MSLIFPSSHSTPLLRRTVRVDALFDFWADAAHEAREALREWIDADPRERRIAHAVYRAALDREESAADALMVACVSFH
jgi:hypothetical protein